MRLRPTITKRIGYPLLLLFLSGAFTIFIFWGYLDRAGQDVGWLWLMVGMDASLVSLGMWITIRQVVFPVREIEHAARRIQSGDFTTSVPVRGCEELATTAEAFNGMSAHVARLLNLLEAERRSAQESEQRLRDLVRDVDAIVWEREPATLEFTFVSARAGQILGYPVEAWMANPAFWADHLHPEDREAALAAFRAALDTAGHSRLQYRMMAASGRAVWIRDEVEVAWPGEGAKLVRGLMLDITGSRETEQALRTAEVELRRVLSAVSDCVWSRRVDAEGRTLDVYHSPAIEKITGRSPESYAPLKSWLNWVHEDDRAAMAESARRVTTGETSHEERHYRTVLPDGSIRWVRSRVVGSRLEDGSIRLDGIESDVTEQHRAEEALRQANEELHAIIQASPVPIYALDLEGRVTRWNAAAEKTFGWTAAEAINRRLPFIRDDELEFFKRHMELARRGHNFAGFELSRHRRDGSAIDLNLWTAPLRDAAGNTEGFISLMIDVTERKMLEEQLRQSQKMEAVGRLAGGVAHDFNNLLTVITGYGYMLLDDLGENSPLRTNAEEILQAVDRATALTSQLLAFSRRQTAKPKALDLSALVLNMDKMLRRMIGEDIDLVTALAPDLGIVKADPGQLDQVVMNLVVNSRDAMPHGGRVTIETANVALDEEYARLHPPITPGNYVRLSVSDTGDGMDESTKTHIFEPFFTTKEQGKGTGLGLYTVYGIVKQSGGDISVTSEPGKGTKIAVYLPRAEGSVAATEEKPAGTERLRGSETVLVVEDEAEVRKLVHDVLRQFGYTVLAAAEPEEAIAICGSYPGEIHLLLTDVVMPQMNGFDLAQRIVDARPGIRVILMSGYTQDISILNSGDLPFLRKPFAPLALTRKIRQVLDDESGGTKEFSVKAS
jgi:PAS domain S-box-containing protein